MKRLGLDLPWILLLLLIAACNLATKDAVPPIRYGDLVGVWTADYRQYNVSLPQAEEILVLRADGTFEQTLEATMGRRRVVIGQWSTEKMDDTWTRIYLVGAAYYLNGILEAQDPDLEVAAWDPVLNHYVSIGNRPGFVIVYATRLVSDSRYDSKIPCGHKQEVVLQHLPIGDLDAPTWVTFCRR